MSLNPKCYILIGLPGSGKSYYRNQILSKNNDFEVISTDDMIEHYARLTNTDYNEAWKTTNKNDFEKKAIILFKEAVNKKQSIIVDRTNMTLKIRKKFLSLLTTDYKKIAVVFEVNENELKRRLSERELIGKSIPAYVMSSMRNSYIEPSTDEFDEIIRINF